MGRATGRMIDEILKGRNPDEMPTLFMTDPSDVDLLINLDVAKALGLTLPSDLLNNANTLIEGGVVKKR